MAKSRFIQAICKGLHILGKTCQPTLAYPIQLGHMSVHFSKALTQRPFEGQALVLECKKIGVGSFFIAVTTLFFVGGVFAFQFGFTMRSLGAVPYISRVTTVSIVRELGPVFTALVVGGRIGAGMAAEIGSMRVTEQIDAIRALGANPYKKLLLPRVVAATFMLPLLNILATFIGILGAAFVSWAEFHVTPLYFYHSALRMVLMGDLFSGFLKPFFFGFFTAIIGCYNGFTCALGTAGVGRATTHAVVQVSLAVLILDFVLTRVFALFLLPAY
ncbi:MAG: ABC transporter permease [Myxococcota bacterium]